MDGPTIDEGYMTLLPSEHWFKYKKMSSFLALLPELLTRLFLLKQNGLPSEAVAATITLRPFLVGTLTSDFKSDDIKHHVNKRVLGTSWKM